MGIYARYFLPRIVTFACAMKPTMKQREKVVPLARGRVLEIGIGSGLNLPYYDSSRVERVWGLDPSPEMWAIAEKRLAGVDFPVEFVEGSASEIPIDSNSADTVLVTYTLCTIPDVAASMVEIKRVLRPEGQLVFCEHGEAPDPGVRKWQGRLNPIWRRMGGGCHLDRPIPALVKDGGFRIESLETMYLPGWKPASFNYWGTAVPGVSPAVRVSG